MVAGGLLLLRLRLACSSGFESGLVSCRAELSGCFWWFLARCDDDLNAARLCAECL